MREFELHDRRHLEAAQGWLELGNCEEATKELEEITSVMRGHPVVLEVRYQIYCAAKKWEHAAEIAKLISDVVPKSPFGYLHMAYALHEMKRTQDAWNVLLPVVDKFPEQYIMRYNLACYACQLGNVSDAWQWLGKAMDMAGKKEVKLMALEDLDLKPLWTSIAEI